MYISKLLYCYFIINFKSFYEKIRFIIEVFILKMVYMYNLKIEVEEKFIVIFILNLLWVFN